MLSLLGPLEIALPVMITSLVSFGLCLVALRRKMLAETFPTLAWLSFMQLPFILNSGGVSADVAQSQMFGILLFTIAFFVGDFCALRARKDEAELVLGMPEGLPVRVITVGLISLVIVIPLYHLANAREIPLLLLLSDMLTSQAISEKREEFGKLLQVPTIMKYTFNWVMSVFGPILVIVLLLSKRFIWAGLFGLWLLTYAFLSTAKGPIVIFVLLTLVGSTPLWKPWIAEIGRYSVFTFFAILMIAGTSRAVEITHEFNDDIRFTESFTKLKNGLLIEYPERGFGLSDVDRYRETPLDERLDGTYKYIIYRIFLTPVEVSYHWYTYFPQYSDGWRALKEAAGRRTEGQVHASNRVGVWAYRQFFPTKYAATVNAYASADADAYSFGGLFAVAVSALFIFLCRILIIPVMRENQLGRVLGMIMLTFLGVFPASASIQAILIPQGFGIIFLFSGMLIWKLKRKGTQS